MKYPHLASRLFNTPLLIHPAKLDAILAGLGGRLLGTDQAPIIINATDIDVADVGMFSTKKATSADNGAPYRVHEGVAIINVSGALVHRTRMTADSTMLLGYNDIIAATEAAMDDPNIHAILQVWDSPGGEVQGAFEAASRLFDLRGKKPMKAIADGMAASAAYLSGSAADELIVTGTGYAGSIGVVARHVDFSQALKTEGIQVTHIFAGAHKVDGNPYEPLPAAVRDEWQAEIDGIYADFVGAVARHMGLDPKAIKKTQARTYRGQAAVDAGLASRVATTDQIITELAASRTRSYPSGQTVRANANDTGVSMSGTTPVGGQTAALTLASASLADIKTHRPDVVAAITQEAVTAELARQSGVRANALPGHEKMVEAMATDGKTTPEQAAMAVLSAERAARDAAAQAHKADAPAAVSSGPAPTDKTKASDASAIAAQATVLAKEKGITVTEALKQLGVTHV